MNDVIDEMRQKFREQTDFCQVVIPYKMDKYICKSCHGISENLEIKKENLDGLFKEFEDFVKIVEEHNDKLSQGQWWGRKGERWEIKVSVSAIFIKEAGSSGWVSWVNRIYIPPFGRAYVTCPYCKDSFAFKLHSANP